jgi:carbamoyltransferase
MLNEAYIMHARQVCDITSEKRLCLAGGVALNCVANQALARALPTVDLFVHPASHDAGTSLGAAILTSGAMPEELATPYLGVLETPSTGTRSVETGATSNVARDLRDGKMVGWFEGNIEIGPRALGHRNIFARPDSRELADRVNRCIKRREHFRPLAPAVQEEYFEQYFECLKNARKLYEYMLITANARESERAKICGVVHVDGTARPQKVSKKANWMLWSILEECRKAFDVPMVLSTSLNMAENETELDVLYVDGERYERKDT